MRSQTSFFKSDWQHRYSHGGSLRQKRKGRKQRPLSCSEPLHVVYKINKSSLVHKTLRHPKCYKLIQKVLQRYARRFFVKIEQISIQNDHIHLLIRTSRRSHFHYFFRASAGQIAQNFKNIGLLKSDVTDTPKFNARADGTVEKKNAAIRSHKASDLRPKKLWKFRPFSRVVKGWRAFITVKNYILLKEKEALGQIRYQRNRLRGLSAKEWATLFSG